MTDTKIRSTIYLATVTEGVVEFEREADVDDMRKLGWTPAEQRDTEPAPSGDDRPVIHGALASNGHHAETPNGDGVAGTVGAPESSPRYILMVYGNEGWVTMSWCTEDVYLGIVATRQRGLWSHPFAWAPLVTELPAPHSVGDLCWVRASNEHPPPASPRKECDGTGC